MPDDIIKFCKYWIEECGGVVCLDQGSRQKDTIYLSLGSSHSSQNHIHLFKMITKGGITSADYKNKKDTSVRQKYDTLQFSSETFKENSKIFLNLLNPQIQEPSRVTTQLQPKIQIHLLNRRPAIAKSRIPKVWKKMWSLKNRIYTSKDRDKGTKSRQFPEINDLQVALN